MADPGTGTVDRGARATGADIRHILGDIDERKLLDILACEPSVADIEEAAAWTAGDGDIVDRAGHPLAGTAAQVYDILTADEEDDRD